MKVYEVSYLDSEDNKTEWFSSMRKASKRYSELKREMKKSDENEKYDIQFVSEIFTYEIDQTVNGILHFLNSHCRT